MSPRTWRMGQDILPGNPSLGTKNLFSSGPSTAQAPAFGAVWKLWLVATVVFLLGHAWFYKLRKSFPDLL
jgi:ABC-type polysaccharide/polyol phosphate export permease